MESNLKGRLRNTNLPKSNALLPLFEAVVNSIHSIDERIEKQKDLDMSIAFIHIHFVRSSQTSFDKRKSELMASDLMRKTLTHSKNLILITKFQKDAEE